MKKITIDIGNIEEFTAVVAGLTRENLAFVCSLVGNVWEIEITGY
jgi:hypothetical protein